MSAGMGRGEWLLFGLVALAAGVLVVVLLVLARRGGRWAKHAGGNGLWETLTPNEQRAVLAASHVPSEGGGLWTRAAALADDVDDAVYASDGEVPGVVLDGGFAHASTAGGVGPAGSPPAVGRDDVVRALDGEVFVPLGVQDGTPLARLARSVGLTLPGDEQHQANVTRLAAATGVGADAIVSVLDETAAAMAEHGAPDGLVTPEVWREASDRVEAGHPVQIVPTSIEPCPGVPGHCYSIDGEWWHDPGTCTEPGCRRTPCCSAPIPMGLGAFIESVRPHVDVPASPVYQLEAVLRVAEQFAELDEDGRSARLEELALLVVRTLTDDQQSALEDLVDGLVFVMTAVR